VWYIAQQERIMNKASLARRLSLFVAVAALLLNLGCAPEKSTSLRVGINPWPGYEFLYLAQEKGVYREEGLEVRLVEFSSLSDARRAYERGQINAIAATVIEVLQARDNSSRSPQIVQVTDYSNGADVILDIFSRYVVGWMIALKESAALAEALIAETVTKQAIEPGTLTLHADRGTSMRSKPVAALLVDLDVAKSHSRPHVSDDNPFSEAQFKTLKYQPDFPERFGCIEEARGFCQEFFTWYNAEHRHSGIGYMLPEAVHYGHAAAMFQQRAVTLDAAFRAHPNRFKGNAPRPPELPIAVWINPPKKETAEKTTTQTSTLN
jgi:Integrase core domain/NMT1-like family